MPTLSYRSEVAPMIVAASSSGAQNSQDSNAFLGSELAHRLINTNSPITQIEEATIRHELAMLERHGSRLKDDLANARKRVKILEKNYRQHSEVEIVYCALISPLRRMPPEIMGEIFLHYLGHYSYGPDGLYAIEAVTLDIKKGPWVLARVCSRWRAIAHSHSRLWSTIALVSNSLGFGRGDLHLTNHILLLTKQSELDISLTIPSDHVPTHRQTMSLITIALIMNHSPQFSKLEINFPERFLSALRTIRRRLPSLHTLHLTIQDRPNAPVLAVNYFKHAPRLEHVSVSSFSHRFRFPWRQLRTFHQDGFTFSFPEEVNLLKKTLNMETYTLQSHRTSSHSTMPDALYLNRLTELRMNRISPMLTDPHVISVLILPKLTTLDITLKTYSVLSAFSTIVKRSSCNIESLVLRKPQDTNDLEAQEQQSLRNFFLLLPKLRHLTFFYGTMHLDLLWILCVPLDNLLPSLHSLTLDVANQLRGFSNGFLHDFAYYRASKIKVHVQGSINYGKFPSPNAIADLADVNVAVNLLDNREAWKEERMCKGCGVCHELDEVEDDSDDSDEDVADRCDCGGCSSDEEDCANGRCSC